MILSKTVEVKVSNHSLNHYKELGYNVKCWDTIIIPVEHLTHGSTVKINAKCDICDKETQLLYSGYLVGTKNFTEYYACSRKCAQLKIEQTNLKKYGVKNVFQSEEVKNKINKTCLDIYGTKSPMQNENVKKKGKQTKKEKYGDPNYCNPEKIKQTKKEKYNDETYNNREKSKQTCLKNHGVEWSLQSPEVREKGEETMKEKYGVIYPSQSEEIKEKARQTKLKNHGDPNYNNREKFKETNMAIYDVEYPLQNTEMFERVQKSGFKFKEYKLPSGKIVKVQGYEPLALDLLIKLGYKEEDLLIKNKDIENKIGKIWYINDIGKKRRYYPDIYIISENKIIEVKSTYHYKWDIKKNLLKEQRCLEMNMKFEFMVFNDKKQLLSEQEIKNLMINT